MKLCVLDGVDVLVSDTSSETATEVELVTRGVMVADPVTVVALADAVGILVSVCVAVKVAFWEVVRLSTLDIVDEIVSEVDTCVEMSTVVV